MSERGKGFPRLTLYSAVKIIDAAAKFGKTWTKEQFAGFGSQSGAGSAKSGAFAVRVASLRDYGLVTSTKESIAITELGMRVAKPVTDSERSEAIKEAFLNVAPFRSLYEGLETDAELSLDHVAQYAVYNLGVSRESKDKFVSVFIDSGKYVGFVNHNKESATITLKALKNTENNLGTAQPKDDQSGTTGIPLTDDTEGGLLKVPTVVGSYKLPNDANASTEQGVNHAGNGWTLTVVFKTTSRLDSTTRKKMRDLLELADEVADELHIADERLNQGISNG